MDFTIPKLLAHWMHGKPVKIETDTLYNLGLIWWDRIGKILQFAGGLTIVAEIIGREKVGGYKKKIEGLVNIKEDLRKAIRALKRIFVFLRFVFRSGPAQGFYDASVKNKDEKLDKTFLIRRRDEFLNWRLQNSVKYRKWYKERKFLGKGREFFETFLMWTFLLFSLAVTCAFVVGTLSGPDGGIVNLIVAIIVLAIFWRIFYKYIFIVVGICILILSFAFLPELLLIYSLVQVLGYVLAETLVFKPVLMYLYISSKEKTFKLLCFILLFIGFFLDLICS